MPTKLQGRFKRMRKRTRAATAIQKLIRGYLARKKVAKRKAKVYTRYSGGKAGYKKYLRSHKYYGSIGKAKGKRSAYY